MKTSTLFGHALGIGAAAAILAACGGNQSAAPQLPVTLGSSSGATTAGGTGVSHRERPLRYTIADLGTLGGTFSESVGVSSQGDVSGYSTLPGDSIIHAYYWHNSHMTDLGTLGGPNSFAPEEGNPNERGRVAGMSDTSAYDPYYDNFCGIVDFEQTSPYICSPFVWEHGKMMALPTLSGPNAAAIGINSRGASVGISETTYGPCGSMPFYFLGVIWLPQRGEMEKLLPLSGDDASSATAINDKDEAVGTSGTCANGPIEAVLWRRGAPINLGTLGGALFNIAFGVNNRSEVVGQSDLYGDYNHHAFLWRKGKMTDLGSIAGLPTSIALGINNNGQIVGFSQQAQSAIAGWIWQNGTMTNLNTLIPPSSPLYIFEALEINGRGQVVGQGYNSVTGQIHAFLATPCDEGNHDPSCDDARSSTSRTVAIPQSELAQLHRFDRFGGWLRR